MYGYDSDLGFMQPGSWDCQFVDDERLPILCLLVSVQGHMTLQDTFYWVLSTKTTKKTPHKLRYSIWLDMITFVSYAAPLLTQQQNKKRTLLNTWNSPWWAAWCLQ